MAKNVDFIDFCLSQNQIVEVSENLIIHPKFKMIHLKYNVLGVMQKIQNEWVEKGRSILTQRIYTEDEQPCFYLLMPQRLGNRYFSGLTVSIISNDVYSILSLFNGENTVNDILKAVAFTKSGESQSIYKTQILDWLNAHKELWYQ